MSQPDTAAVVTAIRAALPAAEISLRQNPGPSGQHSILAAPASLVSVATWLRDTPGMEFDFLSNATGVDWPDPKKAAAVAPAAEGEPDESAAPREDGFLEVVYHLFSTSRRVGPLVLRCRTANRSDAVDVPSLTPVFRSAEFQEREIFDLFGVKFAKHPDLRRILMWDEFTDHPMRKDYVPPDDFEYEPTPHDAILAKVKARTEAA